MKSIFKKLLLATLPVLFMFSAAIAQPPPPGNHGENEDQSPFEEAPIGSGLALLLGMGAVYGAKKVYDARKQIRG